MKVFLVQGNDFPDSVWATQKAADDHIEKQKAEDKKQRPGQMPIHWRVYEYEVQS